MTCEVLVLLGPVRAEPAAILSSLGSCPGSGGLILVWASLVFRSWTGRRTLEPPGSPSAQWYTDSPRHPCPMPSALVGMACLPCSVGRYHSGLYPRTPASRCDSAQVLGHHQGQWPWAGQNEFSPLKAAVGIIRQSPETSSCSALHPHRFSDLSCSLAPAWMPLCHPSPWFLCICQA